MFSRILFLGQWAMTKKQGYVNRGSLSSCTYDRIVGQEFFFWRIWRLGDRGHMLFQGSGLDGKGDGWIKRDSSGLGARVTRGVAKDAF